MYSGHHCRETVALPPEAMTSLHLVNYLLPLLAGHVVIQKELTLMILHIRFT